MKSFLLKPLYNRAVDGLPGLGTPAEMAGHYVGGAGSLHERAEEMAQRYRLLSASTGFAFGLGGFITMPVTLPANIIGVALLQAHLCAATAFMGGHDPRDSATRDTAIRCLTSDLSGGEREEAEEVFDRSAVKLAERGLRFIAEGAVGLATRASKWGATKFVTRTLPRRSLPLVGGVIGGASDAYSTGRVATAAREAFLSDPASPRFLADLESVGDGAG